MVVAGTEGREEEAEKNEEVGPAFAAVEECGGGDFTCEKQEAHSSEDCEWEIRSDVTEVGDAEPRAVVGEIVIGERLGDAWDE